MVVIKPPEKVLAFTLAENVDGLDYEKNNCYNVSHFSS